MSEAPRRRRLEQDAVRLAVPAFVEIRDWWHRYAAAMAYRRERAGEAVHSREKKGPGQMLARAVVWLYTRSDADLERIDREGAALMEDLERLEADYGMVPGRDDPPSIPRRGDSMFARPADRRNPTD